MKPSIRKIDDLREWFFSMKLPFWTIWNGFGKDQKDRAAVNNDIPDLQDSWDALENHLRRKIASGGRLTIFITDKAGTSNGLTEFLELQNSYNSQSGIAGIGSGDPNFIAGKPIEVYVAEQVDAKIAGYEKDREIAELKAALAEKNQGSGIQKVFNRVADELPIQEIIMAVISKYLGSQFVAQTAINGPPQPQADMHELTQEQADAINESLIRIQVVFPDIPNFLDKLATWIEKNPEMAKTFFKQA
ncbi:MAG: hypothetical protein IPG12_14160 [Saprospiraceae bacterium]|nr:hypothetical protein [Saprospiraceae bacterium]